MKEREEEIVAMNHHFDESNDLIFTVFIIVINISSTKSFYSDFRHWSNYSRIPFIFHYLDNFISIFLYVKWNDVSGNSNRIDSIINILIRYSH